MGSTVSPAHKRILFIHHSTGGLLLRFGRVRQLLNKLAPELELWDHGYNLYPWLTPMSFIPWFTFHTGLSDGTGRVTGRDFNIVISNNSPEEYADIFSRDRSDKTLSQILEFDLVIFKNCFPASKIASDDQLKRYREYYVSVFEHLARIPNSFIVFTAPPLRQEMTSPEESARARDLVTWMKDRKNIVSPNISVFDFFGLLADSEGNNKNMLMRRYCTILPFDSHPNIRANREIGPVFTDVIVKRLKGSG